MLLLFIYLKPPHGPTLTASHLLLFPVSPLRASSLCAGTLAVATTNSHPTAGGGGATELMTSPPGDPLHDNDVTNDPFSSIPRTVHTQNFKLTCLFVLYKWGLFTVTLCSRQLPVTHYSTNLLLPYGITISCYYYLYILSPLRAPGLLPLTCYYSQ